MALDFVKVFSCLLRIMWILSFINKVNYTNYSNFSDTISTLHSWHKSHWIRLYNPFHILLGSVYWCFVEDLNIYIHKEYRQFSFLITSSPGFSIRVILASLMRWEVLPLLFSWKDGINYSLNVWCNSPEKSSGPEFFFVESFVFFFKH